MKKQLKLVSLFVIALLPLNPAHGQAMHAFSPPDASYTVNIEGTPTAKANPMGIVYAHDEKDGGYWVTVANVPIGSNNSADIVTNR